MVLIREALEGDAEAIRDLVAQLAEHLDEESPITEDVVLRFLAVPGCGILVAEEAGRTVGCLSFSVRPGLYHAAPSCLIEDLVVHRDLRGRGIGDLLMKEVLRRARSEGCAEVSVTVMPENHRALAFYRGHGLLDEAVFLEIHL